MKITKQMFIDGALDPETVKVKELKEFCALESIPVECKGGKLRSVMLNEIVAYLEALTPVTETANVYDLDAEEPTEPVTENESKGRYGLGIRPNGEHICPAKNGGPDQGANALNRTFGL